MAATERTLSDLDTMLLLRRSRCSKDSIRRTCSGSPTRPRSARSHDGERSSARARSGDELIVIVDGSVRVVQATADGGEREIRRYEAGEHIGELAVLRERPRAATVVAAEPRPRPGHQRGRAEVDPARATRGGDGDAGHARRADQHAVGSPDARARPSDRDLPTGTVTFLRTDVEGSMALARALGAGWDALNATHAGLIRGAIDAHGGVLVRTEGDGIFAVFTDAGAAVAAAVDAQRLIGDHAWPREAPSACGWACTRARRIGRATTTAASRSTAPHGSPAPDTAGRSSCRSRPERSSPTRLPDGVLIRDLGLHVLKDVPRPGTAVPAGRPGPAHGVPAAAHGRPTMGNVPGAADELRRPATRARRAARAPGRAPPADAHRARRHRQDPTRHRARPIALDRRAGRHVVRRARRDRGAGARSVGRSPGPWASSTDRSDPRPMPLLPYLADRSALLVLDNLEHLMGATSDVTAILRGSPGTRVVVTSRSPLRIGGEQEYPVRPLEASASGSHDSVALFVERAQRVRPGFDPGRRSRHHRRDLRAAGRTAAGHRAGRRPRRRCCPCPPSATGWARACPCRAPGSAMCPIDSGRWKVRSAGATPCCRRSDSGCCARSRSSMAGSIWSRSTPSRAAPTCSMGSSSSSTRAS